MPRIARVLLVVSLTGAVLAGTASAASAVSTTRAQAGPSGVTAGAAAVANAVNGTVLWSRDLNTERPMASITKVMTALLVLRAGGLNDRLTVPSAVIGYIDKYDASNAGLVPGDQLTVEQLLYALLLPSGADAAYTLAEAYGPGLPAFVTKMNTLARELGMSRTHFSNPDGLPYPTGTSDYSTAANLLTLGRDVMRYTVFRQIVRTAKYHLSSGDGHHAYTWDNLNPLLGHYPGTTGIKTGWTPSAGHCLLFEVSQGGVTLIGVNLDSPGDGSTVNGDAATAMLNWAFMQPGA
jgi:serine-type D-Ala-D-Ala carboxypeptidase (penicillin-binding protein 5/6)